MVRIVRELVKASSRTIDTAKPKQNKILKKLVNQNGKNYNLHRGL